MTDYYIRATNQRGGPITFSLGVPVSPDEVAGRAPTPPRLMLDKGPNKVAAADLAAQPAAVKDAWDRYVREGVIEVAPWTQDDERALNAPKSRPVNEIKLAPPRTSETYSI